MKAKAVVFTDRNTASFEGVDCPDTAPDQVVVRIIHSWISNGTDGSYLRGERFDGDTPWRPGDAHPFPIVAGHQKVGVVALFGVLREQVEFGFIQWCGGLHLVGYGSQNRFAAERALEHIKSGALRLSPLISATRPLGDCRKGVKLLERKDAIKVCFIP